MLSKFYFRIIWSNFFIAIGIDKKLKNNIKIPITLFYFWPRINGWEILKHDLDLKPWLREEEKVFILNTYTKIILIWKNKFKEIKGINFFHIAENENIILTAID